MFTNKKCDFVDPDAKVPSLHSRTPAIRNFTRMAQGWCLGGRWTRQASLRESSSEIWLMIIMVDIEA
jgi:hypothetical protein